MITLTTDFGLKDWFVGTMKGVMLRIAPRARIVDISHEIPPGDIRAGAFALNSSYRFFPKGTIHLVVVDPGVGTSRRALVVKTSNYLFIGPDNGVLSWALRDEKIKAVHALENARYSLHTISQTFHGRDIFAPAAAHLARGLPLQKLGPAVKDFVRLPWPQVNRTKAGLQGEIVYVDRFGNGITNVPSGDLPRVARVSCELRGRSRHWSFDLRDAYGSVAMGKPLAVAGSSGLVEVSVNGGSAAKILGPKVGMQVKFTSR